MGCRGLTFYFADPLHSLGLVEELVEHVLKTEDYCWMLHEIAKALGTAKNLPAVLNLIVKSAVDALNVKACSLRLLDRKGEKLELAAAYGLSDEYLGKGPVEVGKSPVDQEAMKGEPVFVEDVESDGRLQYPDEARKEGIKSMICVPLKVRDQVIGSLRAYSTVRRGFSGSELTFLTALANLGAIAIDNARLMAKWRSRVEKMSRLLDVSKKIASSLRSEDVFQAVVQSAVEGLGAKGGTLRLLDDKKRNLDLVASVGLSEKYLAKGSVRVQDEIEEVMSGKVVGVLNAESDPRIKGKASVKQEGIKSILAAPITVKGRFIGVLKVYTLEEREFDEEEVEYMAFLASLGGVAIENARLYRLALTNWETLVRTVWGSLDVWSGP